MPIADKRDIAEPRWDRVFAPSSCFAVITTASASGAVNAAAFGTCTRISHGPMCIAFTSFTGSDTARNILETGEFVVNLPPFDREILEKTSVTGLPFAPDVNELDKAGLTGVSSKVVAPPRVADCNRHFECRLEWSMIWKVRRMLICGSVVAVSADDDCLDGDDFLIWDKMKPAHYCGEPYGSRYVAAYETLSIETPYKGPEADVVAARIKAF